MLLSIFLFIIQIPLHFLFNSQMNIIHEHMVQGILDSNIPEDGGPECYAEIPKTYHVLSSLVSAIIHCFVLKYCNKSLVDDSQKRHKQVNPSILEKTIGVFCIISLCLTFYFKWITKKGIFILNPCHFSVLMIVFLLFSPTSNTTRKFHTIWTSWIFGAMLALIFPHLEGVTPFEVYLYYFEHYLIVPIGPLILYRRYGFAKPNFKNQLSSFATVVLYQLLFLAPWSILTKVNLNFALCHSPADPLFEHIRHHYFIVAMIVLNIISFISRNICYLSLSPLNWYWSRNQDSSQGKSIEKKGIENERKNE